MYLFDMNKVDRSEDKSIQSKFRDSQARVRSTSPIRQIPISSLDQLNTKECREAIYLSHGIISSETRSAYDSPLKYTAPALSARLVECSPI